MLVAQFAPQHVAEEHAVAGGVLRLVGSSRAIRTMARKRTTTTLVRLRMANNHAKWSVGSIAPGYEERQPNFGCTRETLETAPVLARFRPQIAWQDLFLDPRKTA